MLECADGKTALMSNEKREKIKQLTGSAWDIIGHEIIFQSKKPLVVFVKIKIQQKAAKNTALCQRLLCS